MTECVKVSNELLKKDLLSIKEAVLWIKLVRELNDFSGAETNAASSDNGQGNSAVA